ncbi:hypothetical protein O3G_MSEX014327 [Manduca sexta]|uniref:Reverse transcriptase domain-containing protein n=1 Tax=Manduca sexta TaxID=7130 RepID=A0A921ZVT2_MANSE|nr:hypothetical protein O3G_MSEX014327 [Manduca sexta]
MCFIDYTKAFDSLYYEAIWTSLAQQGVDQTYIKLIRSIYSKCQAKVRLERTGTEFPIQKGVRQGDPLSPKLFSAVLESVFRSLNWKERGVKIDGEFLSHLRFADDVVIFAKSAPELENMVTELAAESLKVGLSMNMAKTKVLTNSEHQNITIGLNRLEYVEEYIYLGQLVSFVNSSKKEIQRRIALAWKKYWGLKEIMKNNSINMHIKKKVYDMTILPCLPYGCQTWSLRKIDEEKLAISQRKMERSMLQLQLSDKVSNTIIRNKTKIADVRKRIRTLKWNWAGHICRLENNRWAKRITEWIKGKTKGKKEDQR